MTPEAAKASLDRAMRTADSVILQRGMGPNAQRSAMPIRVRFMAFAPTDLAGTVTESDRRAIVSADDVQATGLAPLAENDRLDLDGRLFRVAAVDDTTRRVAGVLIAYDVRVTGA